MITNLLKIKLIFYDYKNLLKVILLISCCRIYHAHLKLNFKSIVLCAPLPHIYTLLLRKNWKPSVILREKKVAPRCICHENCVRWSKTRPDPHFVTMPLPVRRGRYLMALVGIYITLIFKFISLNIFTTCAWVNPLRVWLTVVFIIIHLFS